MNLNWRQRVFAFALLGLLLAASIWVLRPFMEAAAWAAILGWVTWPIYRWMRPAFGRHDGLAALMMTFLLIVVAAAPAVLLFLALAGEVERVLPKWLEMVAHGPPLLPDKVASLPVIGEMFREGLDSLWLTLRDTQGRLGHGAKALSGALVKVAGSAGRVFGTVGMTIFIVYFLFRYGEEIIQDVRAVAHQIAGPEPGRFLDPVGRTIRAVVYGILLTAMVQGTLAGLGYWVAGVTGPALLGALTAFLALFPFGAPLVWVPASLWLWSEGHIMPAFGLALWGFLVVGTADNVIRPWVISGATKVPFIFVFLGVIGGVMAFGLIGLFLGPVLLSVLLTLWRESAVTQEAEGSRDSP